MEGNFQTAAEMLIDSGKQDGLTERYQNRPIANLQIKSRIDVKPFPTGLVSPIVSVHLWLYNGRETKTDYDHNR